jgi:hypothetical protein
MAKYRVTVLIQLENIEKQVVVEANSEEEAKLLGTRKVDNTTCSDDFGEADVLSIDAVRAECVEPPVYDPGELIL